MNNLIVEKVRRRLEFAVAASVLAAAMTGAAHGAALQVWGVNMAGELGSMPPVGNALFYPHTVVQDVSGVAAGGLHSLMIQGGSVYATGYNGYGELGDGTLSRLSRVFRCRGERIAADERPAAERAISLSGGGLPAADRGAERPSRRRSARRRRGGREAPPRPREAAGARPDRAPGRPGNSLPGAESARVSIVIIITYLIGIGGFNHVIAGSTTMFFLVVTGSISWWAYTAQFFIPTLLGNVIGGLSLVAALGHAQVVGGKED